MFEASRSDYSDCFSSTSFFCFNLYCCTIPGHNKSCPAKSIFFSVYLGKCVPSSGESNYDAGQTAWPCHRAEQDSDEEVKGSWTISRPRRTQLRIWSDVLQVDHHEPGRLAVTSQSVEGENKHLSSFHDTVSNEQERTISDRNGSVIEPLMFSQLIVKSTRWYY